MTVVRVIFQGCQDASLKCAPKKLERIQRVTQSAREKESRKREEEIRNEKSGVRREQI